MKTILIIYAVGTIGSCVVQGISAEADARELNRALWMPVIEPDYFRIAMSAVFWPVRLLVAAMVKVLSWRGE